MTTSEQEYIKQIYLFCKREEKINTNELALLVNTKASSVTDMLKKLSAKNLIIYERYRGVRLSRQGMQEAIAIIRRFLLWELFLIQELKMEAREAKQVAAQLQSVSSEHLEANLLNFLGSLYDIRGELIPKNEYEAID